MKHAYLIMAHNEFKILRILLSLLDHKDNDVYLHIDSKVKDFDEETIRSSMKFSKVFFLTPRMDLKWGGKYSCRL